MIGRRPAGALTRSRPRRFADPAGGRLSRPGPHRFHPRFAFSGCGGMLDWSVTSWGWSCMHALWTIAGAVFLVNIPFGYWRACTRRFSWCWFLAIHIPVLIVIVLRICCGLGWEWVTFPVLIAAFCTGQSLGGRIHRWTHPSS